MPAVMPSRREDGPRCWRNFEKLRFNLLRSGDRGRLPVAQSARPPSSEPPIASAVTRESAACVKNSQLSAHSYPAPRVGAGRRAALFDSQCRISSRSSRQQKLVRVGGFGNRNTICKLHPGSSRLGGLKHHAHSSGILQSRALRMVAMVWGHQQRYAEVK